MTLRKPDLESKMVFESTIPSHSDILKSKNAIVTNKEIIDEIKNLKDDMDKKDKSNTRISIITLIVSILTLIATVIGVVVQFI